MHQSHVDLLRWFCTTWFWLNSPDGPCWESNVLSMFIMLSIYSYFFCKDPFQAGLVGVHCRIPSQWITFNLFWGDSDWGHSTKYEQDWQRMKKVLLCPRKKARESANHHVFPHLSVSCRWLFPPRDTEAMEILIAPGEPLGQAQKDEIAKVRSGGSGGRCFGVGKDHKGPGMRYLPLVICNVCHI